MPAGNTPSDANIVQQFVESSTPLAANGVFNGAQQDSGSGASGPAPGFSKFRAMAFADQAGTISIQQSRDGVTWRTTLTQAVSASNATIVESLCTRRYVRVTYTNGGTLQGTFELDSALVAV